MICSGGDVFPPQAEKADHFTEEQIYQILTTAKVRYMAEVQKKGLPYMPPQTRYFSCAEQLVGPWMKSPV